MGLLKSRFVGLLTATVASLALAAPASAQDAPLLGVRVRMEAGRIGCLVLATLTDTPADGVLQSVGVAIGSNVRQGQQVAELDRAEAAARLKIAQANVKELEATMKGATDTAAAQAKLSFSLRNWIDHEVSALPTATESKRR